MDFFIANAFAQQAPAPSGVAAFQPLIMMVIFIAIFYFLLIRPQMKRAKEHRAMVSQLAKGDEVLTTGGIAGRIEEVGDAFITLEIANGVRIKVQKHAVGNVLPKGTLKDA
jgi:preprotein translocase subunit YajC